MKHFKLFEEYIPGILSEGGRRRLLELDEEYGRYFREFWTKYNIYDCKNLKSEYDIFMKERNLGRCYYPQLELVEDSLDESFLSWSDELKGKFNEFDCYLSPFYIENIDYLYAQAVLAVRKGNKEALSLNNKYMCPPVSLQNYTAAWKLVNEYPFADVRESQPHSGKDIKKSMQDYIDMRGYEYKIVLDPYMVARQNVVPHTPELHIKTNAQFSDIDVASLQIHEVDVHIARRYWGAQTGLNLFLDGLAYRNTTDEGMAIYQSLHNNPKGIKPNLQFDIAIKTVIGYHIMDMDFCELFNSIIYKITTEQNKDIIDFILFEDLVRFKRTVQDCKLLGGNSEYEIDYFCGYMLVKDIPKEEKENLIRWNVGPNHIKDIPNIKNFFKANKFKALKI